MIPLAWMIGASVSSWGAIAALVEPADATATLGGMAGPLAAVCVTWWLVARVHARQPSRLTAVMTCAFGVKMLFFGAYVAVMLGGLHLRPGPFVASFTAYFIALYAMEAWLLHGLFRAGVRTV